MTIAYNFKLMIHYCYDRPKPQAQASLVLRSQLLHRRSERKAAHWQHACQEALQDHQKR